MLAGAGQAGGVVEWEELQPHPLCSSTFAQSIRAQFGAHQPLLAHWKGIKTGAGTGVGGKILLFGADEWRSAKEQPWHREQLLLGSTFLSLQPPRKSEAFAVFLILVGTSHTYS